MLTTESRAQVVGEFKDEHRSAFRKGERNGFDALLAAAGAGMIDAIIARHHDRLTRNLKAYDRLIEVCTHRSVMVHYYTVGALDFRTSESGFMGTINTASAQRESDIRSERVKAAVERNVKLGKRTGGGSRRSATRSSITT